MKRLALALMFLITAAVIARELPTDSDAYFVILASTLTPVTPRPKLDATKTHPDQLRAAIVDFLAMHRRREAYDAIAAILKEPTVDCPAQRELRSAANRALRTLNTSAGGNKIVSPAETHSPAGENPIVSPAESKTPATRRLERVLVPRVMLEDLHQFAPKSKSYRPLVSINEDGKESCVFEYDGRCYTTLEALENFLVADYRKTHPTVKRPEATEIVTVYDSGKEVRRPGLLFDGKRYANREALIDFLATQRRIFRNGLSSPFTPFDIEPKAK